tara:strand:+ start:3466 stop:4560 length:1095 start_codon:yes stop_codon:yes gene_type:complete
MKTALIYGATGQDGSYLCEFLLEKDYKVIAVSRRTSFDNTTRLNHLLLYNQSLILERGDVTDSGSIYRLLNKYKPQEVYNLAAQSQVWTSFEQPQLTWDVTANGCMNILEVIRNMPEADRPKFYQASSSEMFGDSYNAFNRQDEETRFNPQSPYAIAKLSAHHSVALYRQSYGLFACGGILFNHESERRGEHFVSRKITRWIGDFVWWCEKQGLDPSRAHFDLDFEDEDYIHSNREEFPKLKLGNLKAKRDWGHAEDYVRAMWLMLQHEEPDDFVIATGATHEITDFLEEAFSCIGLDQYQKFIRIDSDLFRPSEVPYLRGSANKAKTQLGWMPSISFEELVSRMVEHDIIRSRGGCLQGSSPS